MPAAPQQSNQSDNSAAILWFIAGFFVAVGILWYAFKNTIVSVYLHLKYAEANFLSLFSNAHFDPIKANIKAALADPAHVTFMQLINLGTSVGDWLRVPFVVALIVLAFVVYFSNTARMFRHTYSMKQLANLEKVNWPQIMPVAHLDLLKANIDAGPWAMAMTPMQFCKRNQLLEELRPQRKEGMMRKDWDRIEVTLRRGQANKLFALQLGPLWKDVDKLPPYTRALFAAFAARINADSKAAENLFIQLNLSSTTKLNVTGVDELLKKHLNTKPVQKILESHAYVFTVMASMLEGARSDGVQASADFLWLKPVDRKLWYTLNTVGRQTPFAEVAGIFAHWVAEKEAGRKLLVPMVDEATRGLEIALKEVIYKRED